MKLPRFVSLENATRLAERLRPHGYAVALLAAAWALFACLYVMFGRLFYPYELEWMSGAILDHIERVQRHQPLYAAPTAGWIPFLYPPGYYWIVAAVARRLPVVLAGRLVSITAAFVQAACIWRLSRKHGASRFWATIALGAFFVAFQQTDFWYDLERPDSLFVAAMLLGAVVLVDVPGVAGALVAGLVLGAAFFVKQPAAVFIGGAVVALVLRREWARAVVFSAAVAAVIVPLVQRLQAESGGWFGYYVLKMPRAHGTSMTLAPLFFWTDLPHGWIGVLATVFFLGAYAWRRGRTRDDAVFACFLGASFLATAISRLHIGGWANVLMFWTSFGAVAIGVVSARLEAMLDRWSARMWAPLAKLALPLAFVVHAYDCFYYPADLIPKRQTIGQFQGLVDEVRELERSGEVIAVGRGHLTATSHFHMAALIDVITVEKKIPDDILRAFRERRFAAVLVDDFADLRIPLHPELREQLFHVVTSNYYLARRLDERRPVPIVGWPACPKWVFLPRTQRLEESDRLLHERRTLAEARIAEDRERAERAGTTFTVEPERTETIAKDIIDRSYQGAVDPGLDGG